jgi:hypothetical protein
MARCDDRTPMQTPRGTGESTDFVYAGARRAASSGADGPDGGTVHRFRGSPPVFVMRANDQGVAGIRFHYENLLAGDARHAKFVLQPGHIIVIP